MSKYLKIINQVSKLLKYVLSSHLKIYIYDDKIESWQNTKHKSIYYYTRLWADDVWMSNCFIL